MTSKWAKRKLPPRPVSVCTKTNPLASITLAFDIIYLKPGSSSLSELSYYYFYTNSNTKCTTYYCSYKFKNSLG